MSDKRSVSNPNQRVTLLVVDDAAVIRKTLRDFLERNLPQNFWAKPEISQRLSP
jgi:hypothetical protein